MYIYIYTARVYLRNSSLQQFPQSVTVKGKVRFPPLVPVKHMQTPPWLRQACRKVPSHGDHVVQWHHVVTKRKMQKNANEKIKCSHVFMTERY